MKKLILILLTTLLVGCINWPDHTAIERIKVGMSEKDALFLLGTDEWDDYDEWGYSYGQNYYTPSGYKRTVWVTIKNGIVTNIY